MFGSYGYIFLYIFPELCHFGREKYFGLAENLDNYNPETAKSFIVLFDCNCTTSRNLKEKSNNDTTLRFDIEQISISIILTFH